MYRGLESVELCRSEDGDLRLYVSLVLRDFPLAVHIELGICGAFTVTRALD